MTQKVGDHSEDSQEEFEVMGTSNGDEKLPLRIKSETTIAINFSSPSITFVQAPSSANDEQNVIVSVNTPKIPSKEKNPDLKHVPCDIVLVIDVSGSMNERAPLPDVQDEQEKEETGLSILDLTKHAARTIIHTLDERDRLGVVTFSTSAKVIKPLSNMDEKTKASTLEAIEKLRPLDSTNLWGGLHTGLQLFEKSVSSGQQGNVQGIYVLTDGQPNHMNPPQGFVKKLKPMLEKMAAERGGFDMVPTIHTFGFGYYIQSQLMMSIAEVGHGNYAFIPDAGMIGTVFVHAVANIQSNFATGATLILECDDGDISRKDSKAPESKSMFSIRVKKTKAIASNTLISARTCMSPDIIESIPGKLVLQLGNLQYGQSRDVVIKLQGTPSNSTGSCTLSAELSYQIPAENKKTQERINASETINPLSSSKLEKISATTAYHIHRAELCEYLNLLFPIRDNGEHSTGSDNEIAEVEGLFKKLAERIEADAKYTDDGPGKEDLLSLLHDIVGPDPQTPGQILTALVASDLVVPDRIDNPPPAYGANTGVQPRWGSHRTQIAHWRRWGRHYLPSILHAHTRQVCNSFKDPGPLRYGVDSPLFIKCRDELDAAFDSLPAPKPSLLVPQYVAQNNFSGTKGGSGVKFMSSNVKMSRYNNRSNPCFDGDCLVKLSGGGGVKRVADLRAGDEVQTLKGAGKITAVLRTISAGPDSAAQPMCRIGELLVTPWHPIQVDGKWVFPATVAAEELVADRDVYSLLLEPSTDPDMHTVEISGFTCVTLGHGIVGTGAGPVDIRAHGFFGDYEMVILALTELAMDRNGHFKSGGVVRDQNTGLVCGFREDEVETHREDDCTKVGVNESYTIGEPEMLVARL